MSAMVGGESPRRAFLAAKSYARLLAPGKLNRSRRVTVSPIAEHAIGFKKPHRRLASGSGRSVELSTANPVPPAGIREAGEGVAAVSILSSMAMRRFRRGFRHCRARLAAMRVLEQHIDVRLWVC